MTRTTVYYILVIGDKMRGKLIVIEGTDCSGKETQTNLVLKKLRENNILIQKFSYPNYNSPTGKIVGGPYLGKKEISVSYFDEGASHVEPKVASLYYAADRKYNIDKITFLLENGMNVIIDRYVYSNMAHQGGKIENLKERQKMYNFLEKLEFNLLELPRPDIAVFLHMPLKFSLELRSLREDIDGHEKDINHLKNAEKAYIEIASKYNFDVIECANEKIRTVEDINEELYNIIKKAL